MELKITTELLIKHLYKETTAYERMIVQNSLNQDSKQLLRYLKQGKSCLPDIQAEPKKEVVNNILDYYQNTQLETHY